MANLSTVPFVSYKCPACGAVDGIVRAAQTVVGHPREIKVRLECPNCRHSWHETEEHDDGQPDRQTLDY